VPPPEINTATGKGWIDESSGDPASRTSGVAALASAAALRPDGVAGSDVDVQLVAQQLVVCFQPTLMRIVGQDHFDPRQGLPHLEFGLHAGRSAE
jgi:hypothetical protein